MIRVKIKVTKQNIEDSKMCLPEDAICSCAIWQSVKYLFPNCRVMATTIWINGHTILLPLEAREFIRAFDVSSIEQRLAMDEIEFEVEVPDEIIEKINIDELKPLLKNHPNLELV